MNKEKHTKLPFNASGNAIGADHGFLVAACYRNGYKRRIDETNAKFITKACNSHYDLLAACESERHDGAEGDILRIAAEFFRSVGGSGGSVHYSNLAARLDRKADLIDAAIDKVNGE